MQSWRKNMKKLGFSLAVSLIPLPAMAVTTVVDAGTAQTGGLVNPVQTQQVYGTANSFSVYGNQQVMSGGITNDSNVYAGGQQNISSGGTSNGSNIQANAIQTISGTAENDAAYEQITWEQLRPTFWPLRPYSNHWHDRMQQSYCPWSQPA